MPTAAKNQSITAFDYQDLAEQILHSLKGDRDRQILMRRWGLGRQPRQTLEQIGGDFNITRERVRQIEKTATAKLKTTDNPILNQAGDKLTDLLKPYSGLAETGELAAAWGGDSADAKAHLVFLAELAPGVELIPDSDELRQAIAASDQVSTTKIKSLAAELVAALEKHGQPIKIDKLAAQLPSQPSAAVLGQVAKISRRTASLDEHWGLTHWPLVNPKSIRDKTYLVLAKHSRPLHFSDIALRIKQLVPAGRSVTVQAVHNELIKDPRFVLVGRGIYALAEWGYTPGTVADIIIEVLRQEAPLHKDEIVRRVLMKRQVKATTIVLNLQEKGRFARVAKATYKLSER